MKSRILLSFFILFAQFIGAQDILVDVRHAFSQTCADGRIDINILGGYPPYSVTWRENGVVVKIAEVTEGDDPQADLIDFLPGTYDLEIRDAFCQKLLDSYTILGSASLTLLGDPGRNV